MKKHLSLLLSSILLFSGCEQKNTPVDSWQPKNPTDSRVLSEAMSEVPTEKLRIIYVQYSGIVEYMRNANNSFKDTLAVEEAIQRFHSDYGYTSSEFPTLSEKFEEFLTSKGLLNGEDSKEIVTNVSDPNTQISRAKLIEIMETVSDAARLTMDSKNAKP